MTITPFDISVLRALAGNFWWTWNPRVRGVLCSLVGQLCPGLAEHDRPSAIYRVLTDASALEIAEALRNTNLDLLLRSCLDEFSRYLSRETWWRLQRVPANGVEVAFFSAEFGLDAILPTYAGGLGVLAGDILKSASDLGIPLFGVSLLYREGYFRQRITPEGWQAEEYPKLDLHRLPLQPVLRSDGNLLTITLPVDREKAVVRVWKLDVGRSELLLLDTDLEENSSGVRSIGARLYGGDSDTRIRQELVLGIGGSRVLEAMGRSPDVYHMNEGHSAFLAIEQISQLVRIHRVSPEQAFAIVRQSHLFTTHTPVPAGNDFFPRELAVRYLQPYAEEIGIDIERLLRLARINPQHDHEPISMSVLGFRTSGNVTAVSKTHGRTSRRMWREVWPGTPEEEIPIAHVTNGVHLQTWLAEEMSTLFDRFIGLDWRERQTDLSLWLAVNSIPDDELWRVRNLLRSRLIEYCERHVERLIPKRDIPPLGKDILTIGFARRFATYKRATLLFRHEELFLRLIASNERPVQFLFSGKAHPADHPGKELISRIISISKRSDIPPRLVFLEDYSMDVARMLVQGVDVWLNNPRPPLEASGTSGMKAAVNGALNVSILDGWWHEAYDGTNGWAIDDHREQPGDDDHDALRLLEILEGSVIPSFYDRDELGIPRGWLRRVKSAIHTVAPRFSGHRMVAEYATRFYIPQALMKQDV